MKLIIKLFGILMLLAGISLLFKPEIIIGWMESNVENTALYISAIVVRLAFGILFIVVAKASKYPRVIKFSGYLFIAAAIMFMIMGQDNFQDFIIEFIPDIKPYAPVSGVLAIIFGGFLIYAFSKKKEIEQK